MEIQKYKILSAMELINKFSEADLWLANFNSTQSIETYKYAVSEFFNLLEVNTPEDLKGINHGHIIAYKKNMQNMGYEPRTINNRLSAVSSLFTHLIREQIIKINPVIGIKRMKINSKRVEAKVLTPKQVRSMLEAPKTGTLEGIRDKAILHILFFTGCRVSEVCNLKVKDYFEEQGFYILDFIIKSGIRHKVPIHYELQASLNQYLRLAGHGQDKESYLILPLKNNQITTLKKRKLHRDSINKLWHKYTALCGIDGTSPHSARATFITEALENNCHIENVQASVGHSHIKTTQMYDKRVKKYKDSASFSVRY